MMIELPIYYKFKKKNIYLGWNEFILLHWSDRDEIKKHYTWLVRSQLIPGGIIGKKIKTKVTIYYKNKQSDAPNCYYLIDKFVMDALQQYGKIENDNVEIYDGGSWEAIEDKNNPRAVVEILASEKG